MEFWRISVKFFDGRVEEFVSERVLVKEWLGYWLRKVSCGVVWVKREVNSIEDLGNWEFEEMEYIFYRRGFNNKLVWENCREEREKRERENRVLKIDFRE